jgi:hypothetical protein
MKPHNSVPVATLKQWRMPSFAPTNRTLGRDAQVEAKAA